jgi:ketosteroid isomerase-like protein
MPTTAEQVRALGQRWAAAEVAADVATLDQLAADDFCLIGPYGFILDKQQWLDRYRSGDFSTNMLSWDDVTVRQYGDVAIAIGTQTQKAAYKGTPSDGQFRVSQVLVRRGDDWRLAHLQLSLTTPPGPPR